MPSLFDPFFINGMNLKNRIVRSATDGSMATPDGFPTDDMKGFYEQLSRGGSGLIITGMVYISGEGKGLPLQSGVHTDAIIPEWRKITDSVHEAGTKIAMQIVHCGRQSFPEALEDHRPLAPSAIPTIATLSRTRKMTDEDIWQTIRDFGDAASRAKEAGFDAVQIHAAHGMLISNFLSPLMNRRHDEWGGDAERRFRFLAKVYSAVRKAVGPDFPVLCKLNIDDFVIFGMKPKDSYPAARNLAELGLDALEISGGTAAESLWCVLRGGSPANIMGRNRNIIMKLMLKLVFGIQTRRNKFHEAYFLPYAKELKPALDIPLMLVGGFRSYNLAEQVIHNGWADFISMARPLIREPELPNKWLSGNREPAECISCNACFGEVAVGNKLRCYNKKH